MGVNPFFPTCVLLGEELVWLLISYADLVVSLLVFCCKRNAESS